jgi:hypothetical protein
MDDKTIDRFWRNVDKSCYLSESYKEIGECWTWKGTAKSGWYGHFCVDGKRFYSHRLAYEMSFGPIPEGLIVCHRCDWPPCCNPSHLFTGTDADNAADKVRKGRAAWGPTHKLRLHPELINRGPELSEQRRRNGAVLNLGPVRRGVGCGQAKLSDEKIVQISNMRLAGISPFVIADELSISRSLVQQILRGDQWKHVKRVIFVRGSPVLP